MKKNDENISGKITRSSQKIFGKTNIKKIEPLSALYITKHKIAVFVPLKNADELTFAMASAGAGVIGNYTVCSFRVNGIGTFLGGEGSKPKAGKKGKFEMVEEVRIEMICETSSLDKIIDEIYRVHPYEEPAYEIYDVKVRAKDVPKDAAIVTLKKRVQVKDILNKINKRIDTFILPAKLKNRKIKQVVMNFSGGKLMKNMMNGKALYIRKNSNTFDIELNIQ